MCPLSFDHYSNAWAMACKYHEGQMYGDKPYTCHLNWVINSYESLFEKDWDISCYECYDYTTIVVATLHDILEDTDCTFEEIEKEFGVYVADCISLLTKDILSTREDYLNNIIVRKDEGDDIPWKVKVADAYSNLTESIENNDTKRIHRYLDTLRILYSQQEN